MNNPEPGELKIEWRGGEIVAIHGGSNPALESIEDAEYVLNRLTSTDNSPFGDSDPSFVEELEERGYDLSTIEFSIKLKDKE